MYNVWLWHIARDELWRLTSSEELHDACILVYANKMDLPQSMSVKEIAEKMELSKFPISRQWFIQAAVAVTGEGIYEGMDWISTSLQRQVHH